MIHMGVPRGAHKRYLGAGLDFTDFLHIQKTPGVETTCLGGGEMSGSWVLTNNTLRLKINKIIKTIRFYNKSVRQ